MSMSPDELVAGALDLHAHGSPEFTTAMPGRVDNVTWAGLARDAGMRGMVIKSHIFPTTGIADALRHVVPDLEIFGSITLNPPVGGVDPLSVELAVQAGARVVWMPTWSARQHDPKTSIFLERMERYVRRVDARRWPSGGLVVLDGNGALLPQVDDILAICADAGVAVASGHLPIESSLALCERAAERGARFVLTHPLSGSVNATTEQQRRIAEAGGYLEHVFVGCMPMHQRMDPRRIVDAIGEIGAAHCVLSTDAIEAWNPPEPELLRMYIATLQSLGVADDDIWLMTHENPARVLGLPVQLALKQPESPTAHGVVTEEVGRP